MRVEIIRDFVTPSDCQSLTKHFMEVKDTEFVKGLTKDEQGYKRIAWRLTNRLTQQETKNKIVYPPLVFELRERIKKALSLELPVYDEGHGADGVVVSITLPGGNVYEHSDPKPLTKDTDVLRCNILLCGNEHEVFVAKKPYLIRPGDLMCYLVSKHKHSVPVVPVTRILIMFGFVINDEQWETC